jgi:Zn-dependent membrane protease YugP
MSLLAIVLFIGTMALSFWATIRVRQVYDKFSGVPCEFGTIRRRRDRCDNLRQEGIYDVVKHDEMLGDHYGVA